MCPLQCSPEALNGSTQRQKKDEDQDESEEATDTPTLTLNSMALKERSDLDFTEQLWGILKGMLGGGGGGENLLFKWFLTQLS